MPTPILENNHIRLLPLSHEHEAVYIELANIGPINERVNKPFPYTETHFSDLLKTEHLYAWMIEYKGELVGVINSAPQRHARKFQGGYWVHPNAWGKGIAPTALMLVKEFLFNECSAERVQAIVEPHNAASIRVLEKCGYECEGLLKKFYASRNRELADVYMYAVSK